MLSYSDQRKEERARCDTTAALRKFVKRACRTKKQRQKAITRAATMPLGSAS